MMADHFVIDGSNLATEGRTEPSLAQLREAVDAFRGEHPGTTVTVVVDASFEHRIDPSERAAFAKAEIATEVVSPPAGAVGRGDGFLLQIANRTNATVVSNDSFQEFHAEYTWLFEPGRLIGGKPVPGVGWIFSLRRPVRGIVSRKTTQRAKKEARDEDQVRDAIAEATADVMSSTTGRRRRRGGRSGSTETTPSSEPEAVNQPAPFLQFVIDHRLGSQVEGIVDAFSSHGAFVIVGDVRCYVPIAAMGEPRPSKARDVLTRGETRMFVVQAVDAPRRGIELALPGFEKIAGTPSAETVEADVKTSRPRRASTRPAPGRASTRTAKTTAPAKKTTASARPDAFETGPVPAPPRPRKAGPAKASPPAKKPVAKKPAKTAAAAAKKAGAKQAVSKQVVAKTAAKK
ncbi:MAG: S1 RNA-binding domain-containing protein, partial [Acidimicrobiia bacterium]